MGTIQGVRFGADKIKREQGRKQIQKNFKKKKRKREKNKLRVLWTFRPFRLPREIVL
jgi:hypothetical protein